MQILQIITGWLPSGVRARSSRAGFGPGFVFDGVVASEGDLFYSDGVWYANGLAVRPVVYLNSEITVEDLHVIDGQEDNWSTYNNSNPQVASGDASNGEEGNPVNRVVGQTHKIQPIKMK